MHAALSSLAAPFTRLRDDTAAALVASLYGIPDAGVARLDTERDDSFRIASEFGDFVLKIAHPADDPLLINLQTAALAYAGEAVPPLPLPRMLPTIDGELEPIVDFDGVARTVRVLSWLPGSPVFEVRPNTDQLGLLGEALGRLSAALADFRHPAATRDFPWDAAQLPLVRPLLELFPSTEVTAAFEWFDTAAAPRLAELPQQVIHNDFHPGNVLASANDPDYVTGVLDFGDVVHSARIVDLAVALSYLRHPCAHSPEEIDAFIAGFERHVVLTELERELLPALVAARFAERILINSWLARGNPENRDAAAQAAADNRAALAALLEGR